MKRYATLAAILALAAAPSELRAADLTGPRISSPVLGYAFDNSTHAIRTISGVPGAASWGPAIEVPDTLTSAWVHSRAQVAVGIGKANSVVAVSFKDSVRSAKLDTTLGALQQAAFSRSGAFVALSDGTAIEVWTNLSAAPTRHSHSVAAAVSFAVDNNGIVAAGLADGTLVRITGGEPRVVGSAGDWRAVAVSPSGALIAADAAHDQLVSVTDDGGLTTLGTLHGAVSALAVSADGQQVAALEEGIVELFHAGASTSSAIESGKGLDLLEGNLTVFVRGAGRVFDTDTGELRVMLLPSLALAAQGGSAQ